MLFNADKLVLSTRIFFKDVCVQMRRNTVWKDCRWRIARRYETVIA